MPINGHSAALYRDDRGSIMVAGPIGASNPDTAGIVLCLRDWKRLHREPNAQPTYVVNLAGIPVTEKKHQRLQQAFKNLTEEHQGELQEIFTSSFGYNHTQDLINARIGDNPDLSRALHREGMLNADGTLARDFEYYILHENFAWFFEQRPKNNGVPAKGDNGVLWISDAYNAFGRATSDQDFLTPEDCTPWVILQSAGLIGQPEYRPGPNVFID